MRPVRRLVTLGSLLYAILIILASMVAQGHITQHDDSTYIRRAPNYVKGWYGIERSDTLPTAQGVASSAYRWTYDQAHITIWPVPAEMRVFSITYLNPLGSVSVLHNQQRIVQFAAANNLRNAHILLPSDSSFDITFIQTNPQRVDQRILGFIVVDYQWQAFRAPTIAQSLQQWLLLGIGLPLTTLLYALFGVCVLARTRERLLLVTLPLVLTLAVASWSTWHSAAMQPMLQFIAIAGISSVAIYSLVQRMQLIGSTTWLLGIWVVSTIVLYTPDVQGDGIGYYAYIRSLFVDGDLQFANEFNASLTPFAFVPSYPIYEATGYTINPWSIGPAILQVPFWLFAQSSMWLTNTVGLTQWPYDGYSAPYVNIVGISNTVAGLVTIFGTYHLLRRSYNQHIAVFATAFVYIASNLLYYAQVHNNNVHSISAATVTLMMVAFMATQDHSNWKRWSLFGISVGLMGIVYWATLIVCLFPAGVLLTQMWSHWKAQQFNKLRDTCIGIGIALFSAILVLGLQSGVWYIMYRTLLTIPQGVAFAMPKNLRLWEIFFGDLYGLLWWTPALFIGIFGLFLHAKSAPKYGIWMVFAMWMYILYNASIPSWDGSSGFGLRRFTSIAPFVAFGIAYLVQITPTYRLFHVITFGILGAWTTRFMFRYVEFRIVRSSRAFVENLTVATLDPAIVDTSTIITVLRPTWLGLLWRNFGVAQLIVSFMIIIIVIGFCYLWYRPLTPHWWGIRESELQAKEPAHDPHLTA